MDKFADTKTIITEHKLVPSSFCLRNNSLILSRLNIVQRPLEMPLRILQRGTLLVRLEVGMDKFDEAV